MSRLMELHLESAAVALDIARREARRDDDFHPEAWATIAVAEAVLALVHTLRIPTAVAP